MGWGVGELTRRSPQKSGYCSCLQSSRVGGAGGVRLSLLEASMAGTRRPGWGVVSGSPGHTLWTAGAHSLLLVPCSKGP